MPARSDPAPAPRANSRAGPVVLMWENFAPYHHDRARALVEAGFPVAALQLFERSRIYDWEAAASPSPYPLATLARSDEQLSAFGLASRLVSAVNESGARHCFLCHYEEPAILLAAGWLRLSGRRVFTMLDSTFDDHPRKAWREWIKRLFMLPYHGALAGSERSRDYLAHLGIGRERTRTGYDTLDIARLADQGQPRGLAPDFDERPLLVVARLVPQKNVAAVIRAFAKYVRLQPDRRRLEIIGQGPLRGELEALSGELGVADRVDFRGLQDSARVSEAMRRALALILPSLSEPFGLVVNEALANSLPVIVSRAAGAADILVDEGENGFVIDPRAEDDLLAAMRRIGSDEALWRRMAAAARAGAPRGDVRNFVTGVQELIALAR